MSVFMGSLLNTFLSLFVGACIRCYPLRYKLKISLKTLVAIYAMVFLLQCTVFVCFQKIFATDYLGNQIFKTITGALLILIPFITARGSIFQNLFLISVVTHYIIVIFGAGNFVELTWGGTFAQKYPYLICDGVVILLSIPILPLTLKALSRLFNLLPNKRALVWKYIWIIPMLFAVLCMMAANIFMGDDAVNAIFVIGRIFIGAGMIITCFLLARTLKQESDNAAIVEHTRMTETLLSMQREQYGSITENIEQTKAMRHDMRHQLAVIGQLTDEEKVKNYVTKLLGAIPPTLEHIYCENYVVNAVVSHYISAVDCKEVTIDIRLDIPKKAGRVSEIDLCIIVGNFLENAIEACNRMVRGERFIRMRSSIDGDYLLMIIENSFDGLWNERDGAYLSRKHIGMETPREGVGLSSVKAVCVKYDGIVKIEVVGNVWRSSVLVDMSEKYNGKI